MVSKNYLGTRCGIIFIIKIIHVPTLDIETKSSFVEKGKKVREEGNFLRKL